MPGCRRSGAACPGSRAVRRPGPSGPAWRSARRPHPGPARPSPAERPAGPGRPTRCRSGRGHPLPWRRSTSAGRRGWRSRRPGRPLGQGILVDPLDRGHLDHAGPGGEPGAEPRADDGPAAVGAADAALARPAKVAAVNTQRSARQRAGRARVRRCGVDPPEVVLPPVDEGHRDLVAVAAEQLGVAVDVASP